MAHFTTRSMIRIVGARQMKETRILTEKEKV